MPRPYPWYYAVNDRPVKIVQLADGAVDALVFDVATGGFVPDRSYCERVADPGIGTTVDVLTEEQFEQRVAALRRALAERHQATPIAWKHTGNGEYPYQAQVEGKTLTMRVNDFPDEPLYTLISDGQEVADLEDWPAAWVRPPIPQALRDLGDRTRRPE